MSFFFTLNGGKTYNETIELKVVLKGKVWASDHIDKCMEQAQHKDQNSNGTVDLSISTQRHSYQVSGEIKMSPKE